ncbi:hypothetical protein N7467_006916 [Penicillium canescens]|nr:hypothetical protein N7467_006916 [Penicillium canescens]
MALARTISDNKANINIIGSKRKTAREAAIQAVQNPQRPSGQYVLKLLYYHVRTLRSQSTNITLRWIPAHVGVPSNKAADGNAKCAALESAGGATGGGGTGADQPTTRLAAAAKRMVRERIQDRWKKQWESERTAQPTKRLIEWPSKKTLQSDDESGDHEVMEQSPEDAGHSPMLAITVEGGENLDALFEYTLPDWALTNDNQQSRLK